MKKYIVLLLSFFAVAMTVNAQQQNKKKWVAPKRHKVKWVAPKRNESEEVIKVWRPYQAKDNWSLEVSGGLSGYMAENYKGHSLMDLSSPMGGIAVSKQTSHLFSTRFALQYAKQTGWVAEGDVKDLPAIVGDGHYPFGMTEVFLDERLSLLNMICPYNEKRRFDLQLFVGVGGNYSWGIDKDTKLWERYGDEFKLESSDHINLAVRGGLQAMYRVSRSVDVTLQGAYKMVGDSYNGKKHSDKFAFDPVVDVSLGIVMHLPDHYGDYRYKRVHRSESASMRGYEESVDRYLSDEKMRQYKEKAASEVVEFGKLMNTHVAFYTDRDFVNDDQMENLRIVADFLKAHANVNLVVKGYCGASRGSESPEMQLAERRTEAVRKALVRNFNVELSRFTTWYDEDADAPYPMQGEWIDAVVFEMVKR